MSNSFRPRKLTTPTVTVCSYPSGLPIAQTHSPILSFAESPSGATGRPVWPSILMSAMSVSGSAPIRRARAVRPSDSLTVIRSARSTTWLLVRMLPSGSMMNPLPAPRRGASRSRGVPKSNGPSNGSGESGRAGRAPRRRRLCPRVVVSMLTTAGFRRSTTSAKLTSEAIAGAAAVRAASLSRTAFARPSGNTCPREPAEMADRDTPPATIAPTRKATMAVSATVTSVKRRDISDFHYMRPELLLVPGFQAQLARFLELAPGFTPIYDDAGFLADRPGHFRAQSLERARRFLARHGRERPGQDESLPRQRARLIGRLRRLAGHVHPGGFQARHQFLIPRLLREASHRRSDDRADLG